MVYFISLRFIRWSYQLLKIIQPIVQCLGAYCIRIVNSGIAESIWNVMAHSDAREGKWRGNWRMEWVASTLHTTSEHGVSSNTTADAHTSAASSRLNWRPRRFKWTRPFRRKTKSGFCACVVTFQTQSTTAPSARRPLKYRILKLLVGIFRVGFLSSDRRQYSGAMLRGLVFAAGPLWSNFVGPRDLYQRHW